MARRTAHFGIWLLAIAPACGGKFEGSQEPSPSESETTKTADQSDDDSTPPPKGDTDLGDCTLGPAESYIEPCAWVADDRCYESREMACNCACPRAHDSQCASGFEAGPDGHVWVSCD